jgi:hypothetical protein
MGRHGAVASKTEANVTISGAWTDRTATMEARDALKNLLPRLKATAARIIGKSRVFAF